VTRRRDRLQAPFGAIEQREVQRLRELGAPADAIYLLVMLRVRADAEGQVRDTEATLADWTNRNLTAIKNSLKWLKDHGVVSTGPRTGVGGTRGQWRRVISLKPLADWRTAAGTAPRFPETAAASAPKFGELELDKATTLAGAPTNFGRTALVQSKRNPDVYPDDDARVRARDSSLEEDVGRAQRLWVEQRSRHEHRRFTDPAAVRVLKDGVREALRGGATLNDVEAAIQQHAPEEWANTRDLSAWVAPHVGERQRREADDRRVREETARNRERDERIEAEWVARERDTGLTRRDLIEQMRSRPLAVVNGGASVVTNSIPEVGAVVPEVRVWWTGMVAGLANATVNVELDDS
jgi:hypothetical protein